MPSNHLILCRPLLLLPLIFPSVRVFSNESALRMRWPKYWSFSFNISPSNEHPGLISFRMDWLDLLAVQGTLKSLQHRSLLPLQKQPGPPILTVDDNCPRWLSDPQRNRTILNHEDVGMFFVVGRGSLVGFRLWGRTESDTTEVT